ncbi:Mg-chelatase subunit ChlD [Mycobacterium frederiksbergense]|uniref:Mg-chelatase subunit ChlD n=1 Tax=Mycolicibacterium frederiksbergense TaxID=117567 RepID=A0ABT6L009_9MYCO|nr:vWA domain-containing protein [Mycolicibacterium frederiksbergense]MDH6196283.1 Mg-chelatase subunit ChlD [Mycolicibacterium frederiksbergense]
MRPGLLIFGSVARLAAAAILGLGFLAFSTTAAHAAPDNAAVDRYGACLAAQKAGDLLLLIDESGSLQQTDAHAARVKAAQYLVTTFGEYADRTKSNVDVAIAGFSTDYVMRQDWAPLTVASTGAVNDALEPLASHNTGADTDYVAALDGARQTLAVRAHGDPNRCQAIAWFTDGQIDFTQQPGSRPYAPGVDLNSPEGIAETVRRATESICRAGGLADQLRSANIVMLAIGLGDENFDVLSAIATGKGVGGKACGNITDPTPGAFFPVANIDDLLFAFDALNPEPRVTDTKPVCQGQVCEQARHNFVLDRSIKSVNILGSGGFPGIVPHLIAPSGRELELVQKDGEVQTDIDGMPVRYRWLSDSAQTVAIQNSGSAGWPGQWAIVYVDTSGQHPGAVSRVSIHITTDIYPALRQDSQSPWRAGQVVKGAVFGLVDGVGNPVDPNSLAGQAVLSASLAAGSAGTVPVLSSVPKTNIATPVDVDLTNVQPGPATLRMSLEITTAPAVDPRGAQIAPGTTLSPQLVELPIQILPKIGLPVPGQRIDFGTVQGVKGGHAGLEFTGPGCVWIAASAPTKIVASPDDIGQVSVTSTATGPDNCLKVEPGQQADLPVTLHTDHDGHGGLNGTVPVHIAPIDNPGQPQVVDVTFVASLIKPLSTTNFVLVFLAALLLGPGIPLALMYAAKWWVGKIPGEPMLAERIPVEVEGDAVLRDGKPLEMADTDLVTPVPGLAQGARRLTVQGVTLSVSTGRSPFGTAHVDVIADGYLSAGSEVPATDSSGLHAVLPLAVHGKWVVLWNPLDAPNRAEVLLMVHGQTNLEQRRKYFDDIERRLPGILAALQRAADAQSTSAQPGGDRPSPFGAAVAAAARFDPFADGSALGSNPSRPGDSDADGHPIDPSKGGA